MLYYTEKIDGLTPTFRDAVEVFIPKWLDSLLPHYQVAKEYKVDILELANVIGADGKHFEQDGYYYYYNNNASGMSILSLDGLGHYSLVNWRECMAEMYPDFGSDPDPYSGKFCELNQNSMRFSPYVERHMNKKPEYSDLSDKVNAYFKQLTGDNKVGFSLSGTSMLYFNQRAKNHIDYYYGLW